MNPASVLKKITAEALGTALLLAIVIGSGIMGESLSGGNTAIALLGNTVSTGAGLVVLITILGPISGAHFNPVVTLVAWVRRDLSLGLALGYIIAQLIGAVIGVWVAHEMFAQPLLQISTKARDGYALAFSEGIATFGLIATIFGCVKFKSDFTPVGVGLYITSAYWFTASTSFANPAVTIARSLTNSFAGIAPHSVPPFILAQALGGAIGLLIFGWLFSEQKGVNE